jgi:hypothetical protein
MTASNNSMYSSQSLRARADLARFNREANDRAPTAWFQKLKPYQQKRCNRSLERLARQLDAEARKAERQEIAEIRARSKRMAS